MTAMALTPWHSQPKATQAKATQPKAIQPKATQPKAIHEHNISRLAVHFILTNEYW